jgi:hypothetical protein
LHTEKATSNYLLARNKSMAIFVLRRRKVVDKLLNVK